MSDAWVHDSARVAPTAAVGPGAIVHDGVTIGERTSIGAHVVIHPGTRIGDDCTIFDHTVLGRLPMKPFKRGRDVTTNLPPLVIADHCVVGACAVIYRGTRLGERTLIGDGATVREQVVLGNDVLIAMGVTINYNASIGDRTRVMDLAHITGNCVIEEDVFISTGVLMTNDNSMAAASQGGPLEGPIVRKGASVGANSTLLPGIEVGRNAIVGAGAVVSKDVPADTTVMGVPARPRSE